MVDRIDVYPHRNPNTRDKGGRSTGRLRYGIRVAAYLAIAGGGGGALYAYAPDRFDDAASIMTLFRSLGGGGGGGGTPGESRDVVTSDVSSVPHMSEMLFVAAAIGALALLTVSMRRMAR